jgi:hypothetical protein
MSLWATNVVVRRAFWLNFSGRSMLIIRNGWELGYPLFSNCAYDEKIYIVILVLVSVFFRTT